MAYTLEIVDIENPLVEDALRSLYQLAFKTERKLPQGYLKYNTSSQTDATTYFIVAIEQEAIIGVTAFSPSSFTLGTSSLIGYQAVWGATHPDHGGKGVFKSIITFAKLKILNIGGDFLFAAYGEQSHGIFIHKLDFKETKNALLKIPNVFFLKNFFFKPITSIPTSRLDATLSVNEKEIVVWKKKENRGVVYEFNYGNSFAWGKIMHVKILGLRLPYFFLGGIQIDKPGDYKKLINLIFKSHRVAFMQLVSCSSNPWNDLLRGWKIAEGSSVHYFNKDGSVFKNINLMYGLIDVF